jgi:3-methylcrotonyl-CoA carboxylase alpha subunit
VAQPVTAVTLRFGARTVVARVDAGGEVLIDDAAFAVTAAGPGLYVVDDGVHRWHVAVADDGDARWVSIDGHVVVIDVESGSARGRRKKTAGGGSLAAPMPATVVKVLVEPGQTVSEGDTIVVLEAMKMELSIRSPRDGVVTTVRCTPGELVQPGLPLVDLE